MGVLIVLTVSIACDSIADSRETSSAPVALSHSPTPSPTLCPGCLAIQGVSQDDLARNGTGFYEPSTTDVAFSADEIVALWADERAYLQWPMRQVVLARYVHDSPHEDRLVWVFNVDLEGQPAPAGWPAGIPPPPCEALWTYDIWLFDAQTGDFVTSMGAWNWPCLTPGPSPTPFPPRTPDPREADLRAAVRDYVLAFLTGDVEKVWSYFRDDARRLCTKDDVAAGAQNVITEYGLQGKQLEVDIQSVSTEDNGALPLGVVHFTVTQYAQGGESHGWVWQQQWQRRTVSPTKRACRL
jgi:hypothetical protein